jgi:7-dehydrocholesterol reductase
VVPLFLLAGCPPFAILVWFTHVSLGGSIGLLVDQMREMGAWETLWMAWGPVFWGSFEAWLMIGWFAVIQLIFMRVLPGARFEGPASPSGHVPVYKANGVWAFCATMALWWLLTGPLDWVDASIIYDHFGELLGALNVFSLVFCAFLALKGWMAPSTADHGTSGNPIFDYYWGTELYPRVLGWDLKQFTNCRFGMMSWPLILLSFAAAQGERHGLTDTMMVAVILQLIYIGKFFLWETGYLRSLDIMHDRAGFYICWGCLVWVPAIYTSSTLYLVDHPGDMSDLAMGVIIGLGVAAISINYLADAQRQEIRATDGQTQVWGRRPNLIIGRYTTESGEQKQSLLLASGWWGISRHFHYVPEWLGAVLWTLPVGFAHGLPWFYVIFLAILLTDRAFRDDNRCARKYGADWDEYRRIVPWKVVPGLF